MPRTPERRPPTLDIRGETLQPLAGKALYWPRERTLFVADIHVGKAASFRANGVPLPGGSTTRVLERVTRCVAETGARQVVFLGDFLHSKAGRAAQTFARVEAWRAAHPDLALTLVRGNHDDRAGDPPAHWNITCVDEGHVMRPFCLAHHPGPDLRGYVLAGHIHPAVMLVGPADDTLRLPCFWFGPDVGVLPAFGEFTGTWTVRPQAGDRVFVMAEGEILEVTGRDRPSETFTRG